ncbi:Chromosome partitioning protein ParA [Pedobacter cryoconitis]|uniref:Chromosome partitioning protein ParA n=1 Tax=Pedobacter cryoconitis TaxID=188932 RepID=A0A127VED9_9SPHI|nr:ParA family protein [Pedobacter cryoconitis]AMP99617.1 Chromosome partitioning protein ParA [Pedobacter cryoconitis]
MKIIAIINHKGGTGKTTSTLNIGAGLARAKKKTLLIDIDPQSNLTEGLGLRDVKVSIYDSIKDDIALPIETISEYLDIIPSSLDLLGAEIELVSRLGRETILKRLLKSVEGKYDYILIDCAPALGMLTVNALVAADTVMIPLEAEYFAYRGIDRLVSIISDVRKHYNENLTIGGVFITKINPRRIITEQITESIKKYFNDKLFATSIRINVALVEAQLKGIDIFEYAPASNAATDYANLTEEIIAKI